MKHTYTLLLLAGLTAPLAGHATVVIDFETSTDTSLFTANNANAGYTWNAPAGVGGSGGIAVSGNGPVWSYNGASYDVGANPLVEITMDAKYFGGADIHNRVGLVESVAAGFGAANFNLSFTSTNLVFNNTDAVKSTAITGVSVGDWTRIVLTVADNGIGGWNLSGSLYNLGTDGTGTPSLLGSITDTETGGLDNDTSVYAAFKVDTGASAVDNFTVAVPEPGTAALMAGLAVLGLIAVRRRLS